MIGDLRGLLRLTPSRLRRAFFFFLFGFFGGPVPVQLVNVIYYCGWSSFERKEVVEKKMEKKVN